MPPGRHSRRRSRREVPPHLRLLEQVAAHVDDGMLGEIAEADYGMDRDAYLAGLRVLRDELVLQPLDHDAGWDYEVLELVRWSRPGQSHWKSDCLDERRHWMRLLCCVALVLRDVDMPRFNHVGAVNDHLGPMLDSVVALDPALADAAAPFVEWAIERATDPAGRAFLALALLLLECLRPRPDWERVRICAHALPGRVDAAWDDVAVAADAADGWLFGLTHHDLSHDLWLPLIARCLLTPSTGAPAPISKELEALGERLLPVTAARAKQLGLAESLCAKYID